MGAAAAAAGRLPCSAGPAAGLDCASATGDAHSRLEARNISAAARAAEFGFTEVVPERSRGMTDSLRWATVARRPGASCGCPARQASAMERKNTPRGAPAPALPAAWWAPIPSLSRRDQFGAGRGIKITVSKITGRGITSEAVNESRAAEQTVRTVPIKARSAAVGPATASIRNALWDRPDGMSGRVGFIHSL